MKRSILGFILSVTALLIVPPIQGAEPVSVFVSVLPQKTFVEKVGGDHVRVSVMVGPGQSPATYEPTPRQMAELNRADVYFRIGVPFEKIWMDRIRAANPSMEVVDARESLPLHEEDVEDHQHQDEKPSETLDHQEEKASESAHDHDHGDQDPHVWTSPPLVQAMARQIRDVLSQLDPTHGKDYEQNYNRFAAELEALDRYIRSLFEDKEHRRFMVFHPAWGHFAKTYNLTQIAIESGGKEPGPKQLTRLVELAQREKIQVIFVQRQFSQRNAQRVAQAIDARVVTVDPLAEDYLANMRQVAEAFAEALR